MPEVQLFSCPRCARGDFRSLPGPDGKAWCPWCGDAVDAGPAPEVVAASPAPTPPPIEEAPRLAELTRRAEAAEAELRHEQERKREIKKAVLEEVTRLNARLGDAETRLQAKESEFFELLAELSRLKEELEKERRRAADLAGARAGLDDLQKAATALQGEIEARRRDGAELQSDRDAARREASQGRVELAKLKGASEKELGELRRKLAAAESRLSGLADAGDQLRDVQVRLRDTQRRQESERAEILKRDQRIRELQLLIKTLGERLNELARRHNL